MEVAPTTGKKHYQIYFEVDSPMRRNGAQNALGSKMAHMEIAEGTLEQNLAYCSKEETRAEPQLHFAIGDATMAKKKLSGSEVANYVMKRRVDDLIKDDPQAAFHHAKKIKEFRQLMVQEHEYCDIRRILCVFISGPTKIGKTGAIFDCFNLKHVIQAYKSHSGWWIESGYDPAMHYVLLVDEVKPNSLDEQTLQTWTSNFPQACNVKGDSIKANWSLVVITSNDTFNQCFADQHGAIRRRMGVVIEVGLDKGLSQDGEHMWSWDWLRYLLGYTGFAKEICPPLVKKFAQDGCWTDNPDRDMYYWNLINLCQRNKEDNRIVNAFNTPYKKYDLAENAVPKDKDPIRLEMEDAQELEAEDALDRLRHVHDDADGHVFDE